MTVEKPIVPIVKSPGASISIFRNLKLEFLLAGITGGVTSTLVLHPLDLIKVRFQVHEGKQVTDRPAYRGIFHALRSVARTDGLSGLYRGVTPNVWGAGLSWGLYFYIYNNIKHWMQDGDLTLPLSPGHHLLAAAQAGVTTLAFTNPIWVTKTRMCLQYDNAPDGVKGQQYRGMFSTLKQIYVSEGIKGWYRGFVPGIFGVSHGALQFMAYDEMKNQYNAYLQRSIDTKLNTFEYITFAALSKMFAVASTYPYQVVRSRLQDQHRQYKGIKDVITRTWRREGAFGFYKGMLANLLRVTPACCITFVVYETIIGALKNTTPS